MGSASSIMNAEAMQENVQEERIEVHEGPTSEEKIPSESEAPESPETPETTISHGDKPIQLVHQSDDSESIRIFAEGMTHHIEFLYKVKTNRIDVIEAEKYISCNPDALYITDARGESASSYAAFNRNAGLSCLFAKAKGRRRSSGTMSSKGVEF